MKKSILYIGIFLAIAGICYGYWMYNKPHENIKKATVATSFQAEELMNRMEQEGSSLKEILNDEVIGIEGEVKNITATDDQYLVSFDNGGKYVVLAYFYDELSSLKKINAGNRIKFKGKYVGVIINDDDFLIPADIKIENCYLIE